MSEEQRQVLIAPTALNLPSLSSTADGTQGLSGSHVQCRINGPAHEPLPEADETLMRRYQRGDEVSFRMLFARHRAPLLRFVTRLSPDAGQAEEIVQDTWLAIIKGREHYSQRSRFKTYLYAVARRRVADRWRKLGLMPFSDEAFNESLPAPERLEPEQQTQNDELGRELITALERLPVLQREAFLLRAEAGLSLDEIAEVTGSNRETAKSRLRFALQRLRALLDAWHED
jgi:RNA polymerase sigma-70 factor, ECF subfamily